MPKTIQEYYDEHAKVCFGCGSLNQHGLGLKSYWDGEKATASFKADAKYNGWPGFVHGGVIAALMDCHAMATASIEHKQRHPDMQEMPAFVTGSFKVNYRKPTPISEQPLELIARVLTGGKRNSKIDVGLYVDGELTAQGDVLAILAPASMR